MYLENNQIRRYPLTAIIAWFLVLAWMAVIFLLSDQSGAESGQFSRKIAEGILNLLHIEAEPAAVSRLNDILRVLAHGLAFFILALLVSNAFDRIEIGDIRNAILTLVISALYAGSDELHQVFVPGRSGQVGDFLVDGLGIILGILLYQLVSTLRFLRADLRVKREEDLRI